jgi:Tfp pilus assembly protein FimT
MSNPGGTGATVDATNKDSTAAQNAMAKTTINNASDQFVSLIQSARTSASGLQTRISSKYPDRDQQRIKGNCQTSSMRLRDACSVLTTATDRVGCH